MAYEIYLVDDRAVMLSELESRSLSSLRRDIELDEEAAVRLILDMRDDAPEDR